MLYNTSNEKSFNAKSFATVYAETYPLYNESGSKQLSATDLEYVSQPLVAITSFFNLPNRKRLSNKLSTLDLLKNLIHLDLEDEKKNKIGWFTIPLALPRIFYHLVLMLLALPSSTVKLITEFLPGLAEEFCYIGKTQASSYSYQQYAYRIGHFIFSGIHIIGRYLTPSIKGLFPTLRGENGILNLSKAAIVYYGLLLLLAAATLVTLTFLAFVKLPALAFVAIVMAELGAFAYAGYNIYKGFTAPPKPPLPMKPQLDEKPEVAESYSTMNAMMPNQPEKKQSYFSSIYSYLFAGSKNASAPVKDELVTSQTVNSPT